MWIFGALILMFFLHNPEGILMFFFFCFRFPGAPCGVKLAVWQVSFRPSFFHTRLGTERKNQKKMIAINVEDASSGGR